MQQAAGRVDPLLDVNLVWCAGVVNYQFCNRTITGPSEVSVLNMESGAIAAYMSHPAATGAAHLGAAWFGVLIGAVTFTGSIVAFAKLQGLVPSKEVSLPGKSAWNTASIVGALYCGKVFFAAAGLGAVGDASWALAGVAAFGLMKRKARFVGASTLLIVFRLRGDGAEWIAVRRVARAPISVVESCSNPAGSPAAQQCCQLPCALAVICCGSEKAQEARFASVRLGCLAGLIC